MRYSTMRNLTNLNLQLIFQTVSSWMKVTMWIITLTKN